MEPVSVIGLVGAVVGIVNVVGHSALLLSNLRARLKATDLTVTLLIGQLNTVKAALRQIQLWLEESSSEDSNHFQLSLDLESSLSSCGILVGLIDDQLSKLEWDENDVLKFESRARMILEDARTKECLNYLGHLISSLNLLLLAFKCRNTKDQKRLLEDERSREVFSQLKEDSSSLTVMYDSASFSSRRTTTTTATSKFSIRFAFDAELLKHRAYQSTIRALMRRARLDETSKQLASPPDPAELVAQLEAEHQTATSRQVDRAIREHERSRLRARQVLLLGLPGSGMAAVLRELIAHYGIETKEQTGQVLSKLGFRMQYRVAIIQFTIRSLQAAVETMMTVHEDYCDAEHPLEAYVELLHSITEHVSTPRSPLHSSVAAIALCNIRLVRQYLGHTMAKVTSPPAASYFFDSIERILAADYVPTEADIAELPTEGASTVTEYKVRSNQGYYDLLPCHKSLNELRKLKPMIRSMDSVIIVIDLASYDKIYIERGGDCQNKMLQNIALCEFIAKTVSLRTSIILLLSNRAEFEDKISRIPLTTAFSEYTGGDDANLALAFVVARLCKTRNSDADNIYISAIEDGTVDASSVLTLMNGVSMDNYLRDCGLL